MVEQGQYNVKTGEYERSTIKYDQYGRMETYYQS